MWRAQYSKVSENHPDSKEEQPSKVILSTYCALCNQRHTCKGNRETGSSRSFGEGEVQPVLVPKKDGSFHLCGDYQVTIKPCTRGWSTLTTQTRRDFASLASAQLFTKLDLSHAYQQLLLDNSSKSLIMINTHLGVYRLPFGESSALAIFQCTMDAVLYGLPHVLCYLDNILITGSMGNKHLATLAAVLECLCSHGFRLKWVEFLFMQSSVEYLGKW